MTGCERTSSTRMEIEAVTKALQWLQQSMPSAKYVVIVTDSQNILKRVEKRTLRKEWVQSVESLKRLTWIYAPSHTGVAGNEIADQLANDATFSGTISRDKYEIMTALTNMLVEREVEQEKTLVTRLEEMGVERGSGRKCMLLGTARRVSNQRHTGAISRQTLKLILEWGTEHLWQCPECSDVVPGIK